MFKVTPEDGLFNLVCSQCANEVSRWYVFKQQVVRSFEIGRWLLDKRAKTTTLSISTKVEPKEQLDYSYRHDESTTNSNVSNSSSIIEDVEKLETLLKEHAPDLIDQKCDLVNQISDINSVISTIDSVVSNNVVSDDRIEISTSTVTTGPKRKKAPEELICNMCGKQCSSTNSYNRHIKTHDNARPYVCCKCDKPFKTSQVLAEHMKRHYDDRRHKCGVCGQKFYAKASLNDHMRSHTGERPFKCEICGRSFATKAILRQHTVVSSIIS